MHTPDSPPTAPAVTVPRRWDPLVRLTHWGVAAAIVVNGLATEEGSDLHIWVGYAAGALLALRLLWGFIGPAEARFSAFPPNPARALDHLRDIAAGRRTRHRSHNPLGALMVYALWLTLAVVVGTGVAMTGPPPSALTASSQAVSTREAGPSSTERDGREDHGDDEGHDDRADAEGDAGVGAEGGEEMIEEIHELAANLLFALAFLHLAGVAFETWRSGPGVVSAMVGRARRPVGPE